LRAGAGDRIGAWRLGLFVWCSCAVAAGLRAHHVPSVMDEATWLIGIAGWSVLWGLFGWLAYIGSEPYVRRWWPRTLVSWARLLEGRGRDPLVGRHLLAGAAVGVLSAALLLLQLEISGQRPVPVLRLQALESLSSPAAFGSLFVFGLAILLNALIGMAFLVIFRVIVRRTVIAAALLVLLFVPLFAADLSPIDVAFSTVIALTGLTVLLRIGLLAQVAAQMVMHALTWMPLTLDGDAWYFGWSLLVLIAVAAAATYGFFAALGGRPAFGSLDKAW
jgi:serine/threonine-protein kinase